MKKLIILLAPLLLISSNDMPKNNNSATPPNILLIVVDDLGKEWISCYGSDEISTPNIDQLAKTGTKFTNFYGMPQCTPTRVTFLTGQYPFRHGWVNHWDVPRWGGGAHFDETMNPSIAIEMKNAGYKTCIAGKWQIDDFRVEPDALRKNGFDEFCMWTGYEMGNPPSGNRYQSPYIFTKNGSKTFEEAFGPDLFLNFIQDFINNNKDQPMFIYYPMVLTHGPLVNTPIESASTREGKHKAMVKYTDMITGELMQTLEDAGLRSNTLIIWTTDNGTMPLAASRNGSVVRGAKGKTSEVGINLPFIVSWPSKVDANRTSDALIDFTDLFPTFLDIAGLPHNKEYTREGQNFVIDGVSFKESLIHNRDSQREWIMGMGGGNNAKLTENGVENQYLYRDRVLRNKRFKLLINSERQAVAFFDLKLNPEESINLIDSINSPLRKKSFNQLFEVARGFPDIDADPKYRPNPPQSWDVEVSAESRVWKL